MDHFDEISQPDCNLLEELVNTYGDDPIIAELLPSTASTSVFEYQVNHVPLQAPLEQLFTGFTWEPAEPAYAQPIPVQQIRTPAQFISYPFAFPPAQSIYAPIQLTNAPELISSSTSDTTTKNRVLTDSSSMFFLFISL